MQHKFIIQAIDENDEHVNLEACVQERGGGNGFLATDDKGQALPCNFGGGDPNKTYPARRHVWAAVADHLDYCWQTSYTVLSVSRA